MSYQMYTQPISRKRKGRYRRNRSIRRAQIICKIFIMTVIFLAAIAACRKLVQSYTAAQYTGNDTLTAQLTAEGYPKSLIELLERNSETKEFVLDYMEKKDLHLSIDLSDEVVQGKIPLFLQWDERWGYETYGDDFLAVTGCGPTCLSMVVCGLSGDTRWNPYAVACMAEESGYYVDGVGSSWELMTSGAEELGLVSSEMCLEADSIISALQSGTPIICSVGPGDFTSSGHFIVLSGVDEQGDIIVRDPNSRINSEKTWDVETLISQIKNLWAYSLQ